MKICFLTHTLKQDNGIGVFSLRLIKGLQKTFSADIVILTSHASGFPQEKAILYPGWFKFMKSFFEIRSIVKACDMVHALDAFPYGIIAVFASLGLHKKVIITALGTGAIAPLYQRFFSSLLRYSYRRADVVTTVSHFMKNEVMRKVPNLSPMVIMMGVDCADFERTDGTYYPVRRLKPYILSVGQLRWRKGYHFSIQAFAKVLEAFPDLKYVIVGKRYKDNYYDRLQRLINDLALGGKVFILENIDTRHQLCDIYKGAELFCLFSQNVNYDVEGFGLVFLEAAAAGLPAVGSKNCGVEDAVLEGKNGSLVSTRSPDDFAAAIIEILNSPERKKVMGQESVAFAQSMSWDTQIAKYAALYKKLHE